MGRGDGAGFDALAAKVNELGQICAKLSQENAELRDRVSQLSGHAGHRGSQAGLRALGGTAAVSPAAPAGSGGPSGNGGAHGNGAGPASVSRRMIGRALGAAAAGAVGAVALTDLAAAPASAANGDTVQAGQNTTAETRTAVTYDGAAGYHGVVLLGNDSGYTGTSANYPAGVGGWAGAGSTAGKGGVANGVYGYTDNAAGNGVVGYNSGSVNSGGAGVLGLAFSGTEVAVRGTNDSSATEAIGVHGLISSTSPGGFSAAVRGENSGVGGSGIGVWGSQAGGGWGVFATSVSGIGVVASGGSGIGVDASGATGVSASGSTVGVSAHGPSGITSTATAAAGVGVNATAPGTGAALKGTNNANGPGVHGLSKTGRGGIFNGAAAQVQLVAGTKSTHPTSGSRGDLYVDKTGRLWFCKKSGSTATWKQIA